MKLPKAIKLRFVWEKTGQLELVSTQFPETWALFGFHFHGGAADPNEVRLRIQCEVREGARAEYVVGLGRPTFGRLLRVVKLVGRTLRVWLEVPEGMKVEGATVIAIDRFAAAGWLVGTWAGSLALSPKEIPAPLDRVRRRFRREGWRGLRDGLRDELVLRHPLFKDRYTLWYENYDRLTDADREKIRGRIAALKSRPLVSVLLPVYNTDEVWLRRAIESVQRQIYPHWELCIADDNSPKPHVRRVLEEYAAKDERIRVVFRTENGHISEASNSALALARGEFTALLDHDDELTEDALYWVVEELQRHPDVNLLYSDEDKLDTENRRGEPFFKPEWNETLMFSFNLVTHLAVFRTSLVRGLGGFRRGYEGGQDYDLVLRVARASPAGKIRHIPKILYHWRAIGGSTAMGPEEKSYAHENARKAVRDYLKETGRPAEVTSGFGVWHRVRFPLPAILPLVSVVICTRDRVDLLKVIVRDILGKTDYDPLELIIVDNQSQRPETHAYFKSLGADARVRILSYDAPFNYSAMNNRAAESARGEYLAFLNNDLEVITPDWLKEMMSFAQARDVGAVGAKLYFPTDEIQHAGIVLGIGGVAGLAHRGLPRHSPGYVGRTAVIQEVSAVTGACLLMRKSAFDEIGGFDEKNLPVAFNDVDLCLRLREKGYRIIWTPYAELYHYESASRGSDYTKENLPRFERERAYMKSRWGKQLESDPFYNPNLSLEREDYSLAFPPRVERPWER